MTTKVLRRKKPARADVEEEILEQGRWSGLREQHRLERQYHSVDCLTESSPCPLNGWALKTH